MKILRISFLLGLISFLSIMAQVYADECCTGIRGNVDGDSLDEINVADLTYLVDYLFNSGPASVCQSEADVTADNEINITDLTFLVDYLFNNGQEPPACSTVVVDSVILPLTIGNQWISDVTEYNSSGQVTAHYIDTGYIGGDTIIVDTTWYLFLDEDSASVDTSIWTNKDDGAWSWTDSASAPQALFFKYPANPGDSYPLYDVTVTVESINESVTVPAGTFTCYYYRVHIPVYGTIGRIWVAPNIGIVRAEEYELTLFGTYLSRVVELVSYQLVN